jgi:AcrR family transcriptional regulator
MKVSKDKKNEIKKKLINTAVEIITEKGFQAATMREISDKAGYGSATIYHYFPNKEKILYAYFEEKQNELIKLLDEVPDFSEFTLKEKLQIQLESLLDLYLQDREFVQEAYKLMFDSPLRTFSEFQPIKEKFINTANGFFEESISKNEIQDYVYINFINNLYWDYAALVIHYWNNDKSTGFTNTSQFIDMSLDIIVEILKSGIIVKLTNIASFLFKNHIYTNIQSVNKLFPMKDIFQNVFKHSSLNREMNGRGNHGQTKRSTKRKD